MASLNFFYVLSNVLTFGTIVFFISALYFRNTHKTLGGIKYKVGSPEYRWFEKISSKAALGLTVIVFLISVINLGLQISRYFNDETANSIGFVIAVPIVVTIGYVVSLLYAKNLATSEGKNTSRKESASDEEDW